jgi:hypothetical protein
MLLTVSLAVAVTDSRRRGVRWPASRPGSREGPVDRDEKYVAVEALPSPFL